MISSFFFIPNALLSKYKSKPSIFLSIKKNTVNKFSILTTFKFLSFSTKTCKIGVCVFEVLLHEAREYVI
jgi:hypothetical protein